jgi:hypothetical protein
MEQPRPASLPRSVAWLGYGGLLPFLGAASHPGLVSAVALPADYRGLPLPDRRGVRCSRVIFQQPSNKGDPMNAFNRLPGFVQTPAGRERDVLRLLPRALVFGTLLLALPSLAARIFFATGDAVEAGTRIQTVDIVAISLLVLHGTAVLTVTIAAFIVMVMKGPAYVADAYPVDDSESPDS